MVDTNTQDMVDTIIIEEVRYALERCHRERAKVVLQGRSSRSHSPRSAQNKLRINPSEGMTGQRWRFETLITTRLGIFIRIRARILTRTAVWAGQIRYPTTRLR
jgi:hypothetical protein